jgi:hypothetical protein
MTCVSWFGSKGKLPGNYPPLSRALNRTGKILEEDPWHMMPAGLAQAYRVEPPKMNRN